MNHENVMCVLIGMFLAKQTNFPLEQVKDLQFLVVPPDTPRIYQVMQYHTDAPFRWEYVSSDSTLPSLPEIAIEEVELIQLPGAVAGVRIGYSRHLHAVLIAKPM